MSEREADAIERRRLADQLADETAYFRGRVDATLDEHTKHLATINGSIERCATALAELTKTIEAQRNERAMAEGEAIAVNRALREAMSERKRRDAARWSRREKIVAAIAGVLVPLVMLAGWLSPHPF